MKKIIVFTVCIILLSSCKKNEVLDLENEFKTKIVKEKKCKDDFDNKKTFFSDEERKLYLICIDNIELYNGNSSIMLDDYLKSDNGNLTYVIDNLKEKIEFSSNLEDGGTKIYNNKKSTKDIKGGITLVICNTLNGNNDIYIGNGDMDISYGFSKKNMCR